MTDAQVITAIAAIEDNTPNSALEIRTLLTELFNRSYKTGDVMMVSCSNAYITANFDGTGLGINERVGWAICNNNNGTRDYQGRVPLAYGTSYATMGAADGSKDAVVGAHTHNVVINGQGAGSNNVSFNDGVGTGHPYETSSTGVSVTDKNMQPYIVTLFIQKINV